LRDRVPSPDCNRLLGDGSSLAWGDVEEPKSLHNLGVNIAYILPTEFLRSVHELGYDVVVLGLPLAVYEGKRGE